MADKEASGFWLMRELKDKQSLMFVVSVEIEEDDGMYCASVSTMKNQMAAMGRTPEEALESARLLFIATVDDAIAKGASITHATGQQAIPLSIPISDASKVFHILEKALLRSGDDTEWLFIPPAARVDLPSLNR